MLDAQSALARLRDGNAKFAADELDLSVYGAQSRREELLDGQAPFAVILGCSDSRVPVELVFAQDLGDLFVIRVAGNVVAPSLVGSIEYAAALLGSRLVVVMGHSNCGAVRATINEMDAPSPDVSPNIISIVDRIRPGLEPLKASGEWDQKDTLLSAAVIANIKASIKDIRKGSALLQDLEQTDSLMIVGAEYDLASGVVTFLESDEV